jgi:ATP-dependent RNA helicase DeaD
MTEPTDFDSLGLPEPLLRAVREVGYESPSPIQAACIPLLRAGCDLLGQAQTGTGKTAAFALPLLARLDVTDTRPQLLVLTPTRELAIQVAEAMQAYARFLPNFHVLPVYGGQGFTAQLRQLRRGAHVVVGTPGRVMDHMRRGTLSLDGLRALVLDEADEMLRMGFIDDVEWILGHTPAERQIALFSATMPAVIRAVAERHLRDPQTVRIEAKTTTAPSIRQRYWSVSGLHKLDALTRLLETEIFDGVIVFVRTKTATVELAEKLAARGFACEALNGDIPQAQREKTVERLRDGRLDILVATDVAARGLDVQRITHVVNYDIPYDTESYVHRIGRTGRAGRSGEAILFVAPREHRMLRAIEKATGQRVESMEMPSAQRINEARIARFKARIIDVLGNDQDLSVFYRLVSEIEHETDVDPLEIAAALARLVQGDEPLLLEEREPPPRSSRARRDEQGEGTRSRPPAGRRERPAPSTSPRPLKEFPEIAMERFRIDVGYRHGVKPGNIVGAIANEADLESRYIGHIDIQDDYSLVDLPAGMPEETYRALRSVWVCGRKLAIERVGDKPQPRGGRPEKKPKRAGKRPGPRK